MKKPNKISDLTKTFMVEKIAKKTKEEKEWFRELVVNNTKVQTLKNGNTRTVVDMKTVRNAFAEKFYPNLLLKKSTNLAEIVKAL